MDSLDIPELEAVAEIIPHALFVKNARSEIVFMNRACEDVWGITFESVRGTNAAGAFPSEQIAGFIEMDRSVFAGGKTVEFEEVFWSAKHQENRIGWTTKKPLYEADGTPRLLICTTLDITAWKRTQSELRLSNSKLAELYRLSPLGIALNAMDGSFVDFNEAFERITGYPREELLHLSYWELTPRKYAEAEKVQIESLISTRRYGPYTKTYRRKDGSEIHVRLNGCLIAGSDGHDQIWSIIEDISHDEFLKQELVNAQKAAEAASEAKSLFLASASHELRTPMNAILGFSEALEMGVAGTLGERQKEYVRSIHEAGSYLRDLIDKILDVTQIESGRINLELGPVPVLPVIARVVQMLRPEADAVQMRIAVDCVPGLAIRADAARFQQVLVNLVHNAVKYAGKGCTVSIEAQAAGPVVEIAVRDDGIGMTQSQLAHAMTLFGRGKTHAESTKSGIGLGLPLAQAMTKAQGGQMTVTSIPGSGTRIILRFPAERAGVPGKI